MKKLRRAGILDNSSLKIQNNRNRYYDYYTGRWLQRDQLGVNPAGGKENPFKILGQYKDGLNLYEYVGNNPLNYLDPKGTILSLLCCACIPAVFSSCVIICSDVGYWDDWDDTWNTCVNKCMLAVLHDKGGPVLKGVSWFCKGACIGMTLGKEGMGKYLPKTGAVY